MRAKIADLDQGTVPPIDPIKPFVITERDRRSKWSSADIHLVTARSDLEIHLRHFGLGTDCCLFCCGLGCGLVTHFFCYVPALMVVVKHYFRSFAAPDRKSTRLNSS